MEGITLEIMDKALRQAREGRRHILRAMLRGYCRAQLRDPTCRRRPYPFLCAAESNQPPRRTLSPYAPRIIRIPMDPAKAGALIGPQGKTIKGIISETGIQGIQLSDDQKFVEISGVGKEAVEQAVLRVRAIVEDPIPGTIYRQETRRSAPAGGGAPRSLPRRLMPAAPRPRRDARIVQVAQFGVFVEIMPGREGLCHVSELDVKPVSDVAAAFKEGECSVPPLVPLVPSYAGLLLSASVVHMTLRFCFTGDLVDVVLLEALENGKLKLSRRALLNAKAKGETPLGRL